jgi:hypothetical protein
MTHPSDRYRLAPVRDTRIRDERARRSDLAVAVGDADATRFLLAAIARRVDEAKARLVDAIVGRNALHATGASRLLLAERYVERRRHELEAVVAELDRATRTHDDKLEVVDGARGRLSAARAEREVIERHFARWREDRKRLAERRSDD